MMNWFQRFFLTNLSSPASDRPLWKHLLATPVTSILQLGMGSGQQTIKVLELVTAQKPDAQIRFAGVDLFESSSQPSQHLKLKDAHRLCAEVGVKAYLVPGDFRLALPRIAVTIQPSDLVIVNQPFHSDAADYELLNAWLPRLVHPSSVVFAKNGKSGSQIRVEIASICQVRKAA